MQRSKDAGRKKIGFVASQNSAVGGTDGCAKWMRSFIQPTSVEIKADRFCEHVRERSLCFDWKFLRDQRRVDLSRGFFDLTDQSHQFGSQVSKRFCKSGRFRAGFEFIQQGFVDRLVIGLQKLARLPIEGKHLVQHGLEHGIVVRFPSGIPLALTTNATRCGALD